MKEVVIVTTFDRDELLFLCLEAIWREDTIIPIWVFSDHGRHTKDLMETCHKFRAMLTIRSDHKFYGNSFNLISAIREVLKQMSPEIIHIIEDDTIIHRGYLGWADTQLATGQYAAVCGRIGSAHIPHWFELPCNSWKADKLKICVDAVPAEYFSTNRLEMQRVLDEKIFPASKYKKGGAEADGFFLRCIEHHGWKTCFPPRPLATHLGWWGYNSPPGRERPAGSFEDRIAQCRAMLTNAQRRKELFGARITEAEMSGWDGRT